MKLLPYVLCQVKQSYKRQNWTRSIYSISGEWVTQFSKKTRTDIEEYWRDGVNKNTTKNEKIEKEKYYVLSMFPYPSGRLHMGHVRVYTISDTMARYHRLQGKQVIHPMGWDAFGLPAENAAIERQELPEHWTYSNIDNMKKQLEQLCFSFDWEREYATCDPSYYKWTQWIFLKMHEAGLVYQKEALVNWDPVDQTVLADEQIDEEGYSWRSGVKAEKRYLKQWYIKTTAYAKSLYDGLSDVDPDLWKDIIDLQKHWIGECNGCRLELNIINECDDIEGIESVFTFHPECLYGVSHILISPHHRLNNPNNYLQISTDITETTKGNIQLKLQAVHPLNGTLIPIFVSHSHDFGEFLDITLGMPSFSEEDKRFSDTNGLSYIDVMGTSKVTKQDPVLVNSGQFSGLSTKEGFHAVTKFAKEQGCGGDVTSERLKDWLISRQRYWGTPIPIVHCPKKGAVPVAYEDLPVVLPQISELTGKGASPLTQEQDWLRAKCQQCDCGGYGQRETDTMDTFVDSSWYFLRYLDPLNESAPFDSSLAAKFMPVDLYIGGKEHAIMHLYYARFFNHFLYDQGLVPHKEPFVNLLTQGMVMGQSYKVKDTGRYLTQDEIDFLDGKPVERSSGTPVLAQWEKMSKSKHNGVDPQDVLDEYGVDTTRLCILSNVSPRSNRNWSHDVFKGVIRWQNRIWGLVTDFIQNKQKDLSNNLKPVELLKYEDDLFELRNYAVKEVTYNFEKSFNLNVAISRLQAMTSGLKKIPAEIQTNSYEYERALHELIIMLAPLAPFYTSELWTGLMSVSNKSNKCSFRWDENILSQSWPAVDPHYKLTLQVKKNSKEVFTVRMERSDMINLTKSMAKDLVEGHPDYMQAFVDDIIVGTTFHHQPPFKADFEISVIDPRKKKKKKKR